MQRRTLIAAAAATLAAAGGCAGLDSVAVEVSSQGSWPAGQRPGRYAIERLPSQEAQPAEQERVEAAALQAIEGAGFVRAPLDEADVVIQVGARRFELARRDPYAPFHWRADWWFYGGHRPFFHGPGLGLAYVADFPDIQREAAILIRDRRSQRIVYETRAMLVSRGSSEALLPLLFEAAMKDFPQQALSPRTVVVPLPRRS
jgi:hypothetical protein